ncbi:MAG: MFS transporter [Corynebacterium sp.]|nr:MFS transporter [Corynebacterium sp.]
MTSVYSRRYLPITIGLVMAIVAGAFDNTAVTTVMPAIVEQLGSVDAYSLTFVSTYAMSIIGMVAGGVLTDRLGLRHTFLGFTGLLVVGLLLSIVSPTMTVFLASRALQGLGSGGVIVTVYACVAAAYPPAMRTAVFSAFAGAWVVPSLIGPGIGGLLTVWFTWHMVFIFILVCIGVAAALIGKAFSAGLIEEKDGTGAESAIWKPVGWAIVLATGASVLNYASQVPPVLAAVFTVLGLAVVVLSLIPLEPAGFLVARRGVPRLIASRLLIEAMFTIEIYTPLLLAQVYGLPPTLTGLGLTADGLAWFIGAELMNRFGSRVSTPAAYRIAATLSVPGVLICVVAAWYHASWLWIIGGWAFASIALGFVYPRMNALTLDLAAPEETGFISSGLQLAGVVGTTTLVSLGALVQVFGPAVVPTAPPEHIYAAIFALVIVCTVPLYGLWNRRVPEPTAA